MAKKEEFEKNTIIIAAFANESAAVGALAGLEYWADQSRDIELGAVGALKKEDDEIKAEIVHKASKSALVSGAVDLTKSLLGPIALVGNVVGGVAKSLFGKSDDKPPEALKKLGEQIDAGFVALVMVGTADEAQAYSGQLQTMGGAVTLFEVPQEVLQEAAAAVEAAKEAAEQQEKAEKEAEKAAKKESKNN